MIAYCYSITLWVVKRNCLPNTFTKGPAKLPDGKLSLHGGFFYAKLRHKNIYRPSEKLNPIQTTQYQDHLPKATTLTGPMQYIIRTLSNHI